MAETFVGSDYAKVFPSAFRGMSSDSTATDGHDPEAKLMSENNLTGIVRRLTDKDYVISWDQSTKVVEFSVNGYYVKADLSAATAGDMASWTEVWAKVKLASISTKAAASSTEYDLITMVGQSSVSSLSGKILDAELSAEAGDSFIGVKFLSSSPTLTSGEYALKILERASSSDAFHVPSANDRLRFKAESVYSAGRDDSIASHFITDCIEATTIVVSGMVVGNAASATEFADNVSYDLTGDVTGVSQTKGGFQMATTIGDKKVTNAKIANPQITLNGTEVALGGSYLFDSAPTRRSPKPVTSGGLYTEFQNHLYAHKLATDAHIFDLVKNKSYLIRITSGYDYGCRLSYDNVGTRYAYGTFFAVGGKTEVYAATTGTGRFMKPGLVRTAVINGQRVEALEEESSEATACMIAEIWGYSTIVCDGTMDVYELA